MTLSQNFPSYELYNPKVPVWCVTPGEGRTIHRFFDTSPFSPSGRYMALLRLPFEDRNPLPGDKAQVILVDLEQGYESVVAETCGWESQVGANVQWGSCDTELYFNDVDIDRWKPYGVKLNPFTGERLELECGVFMLSPDGKQAATTCPVRARLTQTGYGVMLPDSHVPRNRDIPGDDGVYLSDTATGKCRLLVSIRDILVKAEPRFDMKEYANGEFYGFQCKWNPQGTRLLMVLRWISNEGLPRKNHVITMNSDGTGLRAAIPAWQWAKGGHHINWHPDGEHLTMNLNIDGEGLRFVKVRYDGTNLHKILEKVPGSGHPSVHAGGRYILTDAYNEDTVAYPDGTVPIRLIDVETGTETEIVRMKTQNTFDFSLRVDPHPAWDPSARWVAFNGYEGNTRRVYIADLSGILEGKCE